MRTYRVYFRLPAYAYIYVEAESAAVAQDVAEAALKNDEDALDCWEIDWDADEEFDFAMDMGPATETEDDE